VLGIDKDKNAIEGCRKNLSWFGFDKKKYHLISGDSAKISLPEKFSAIVTEPDLGKIFRKTPDPKETRKILNNFENLIINTINNLKENLKSYGKIVFTSPLIKTYDGKRASCNYEKILHQTGFKIKKGFPIKEFRENQIVGREIFVLDR
jgi:tRNA G10  N-methylase Trm11